MKVILKNFLENIGDSYLSTGTKPSIERHHFQNWECKQNNRRKYNQFEELWIKKFSLSNIAETQSFEKNRNFHVILFAEIWKNLFDNYF